MKTTADKVQELFYKQNPELLKLEFGSLVSLWGSTTQTLLSFWGEFDNKKLFYNDYGIIKEMPDGFVSYDVLGTPPTVLQVLSMAKNLYIKKNELGVTSIVHGFNLEHGIVIDPKARLFKDLPLETQDSIYQLLK